MSRSIHTTWKDYWEKQRYQYTDRDQQAQELEEIRQALIRKRAIKRQRKAERKAPVVDFPPVATNTVVRIEVRDESEYVHYPLSEEDVRAVLEILPTGIAEGLNAITFRLGREYMQESEVDDPDPAIDPYTGRIGSEDRIPGVFIPPVLGSYNYRTNRIFLNAYVYDRCALGDPIVETYLKLRMLTTLLHELAHHEDNRQRIARGRWLGSYDKRAEDYAYKRQKVLVSEMLMELLYDRYELELTALSSWIETHGGCSIPMEEIIKGGIIFTASEAVEELFDNFSEGMPADQIKYHFANYLHFAGYYQEALSILKKLLSEDPQNLEIRILMADIYCHQRAYELAEPVASAVLSEYPKNKASIFVLTEVYFAEERWPELADMTRRGLAILQNQRGYQFLGYLEKQLLAHLFLGNYDRAEAVLSRYPANSIGQPRHQAFRSLLLLAIGDYAGAQQLAHKLLTGKRSRYRVVRAVAGGVFNATCTHLGEIDKIRKLASKDGSVLKNSKIGKLRFILG